MQVELQLSSRIMARIRSTAVQTHLSSSHDSVLQWSMGIHQTLRYVMHREFREHARQHVKGAQRHRHLCFGRNVHFHGLDVQINNDIKEAMSGIETIPLFAWVSGLGRSTAVVRADCASTGMLGIEGPFSSESTTVHSSGYCPLGFGDDTTSRKRRAEAAERSTRPP